MRSNAVIRGDRCRNTVTSPGSRSDVRAVTRGSSSSRPVSGLPPRRAATVNMTRISFSEELGHLRGRGNAGRDRRLEGAEQAKGARTQPMMTVRRSPRSAPRQRQRVTTEAQAVVVDLRVTRFISGEPTKPATKTLAGRANSHGRCRPAAASRPAGRPPDPPRSSPRPDRASRTPWSRGTAPESRELRVHLDAELRVEIGQRFVHQVDRRLATIALPIATCCRWPPDNCPGLRARRPSSARSAATSATRSRRTRLGTRRSFRPIPRFSLNRQVRIQAVVLEDHRHVSLLRWERGHPVIPHPDIPRVVPSGPQASQQRRLATAGGTDENQELSVRDLEADVVDRRIVRPNDFVTRSIVISGKRAALLNALASGGRSPSLRHRAGRTS